MSRKLIVISMVTAALALATTSARADALHGFCTNVVCSDNGAITPASTSSPSFGFGNAGGSITGTDIIVVLTTSNIGGSIALNPTNVAGSPPTSATLLGGEWTSGTLASFLGIAASPTNPFNNYGGATGLDAGATGFFVYELNLGTQKVQDQANELNGPLFSAKGLPTGTFILDFVDVDDFVGTPNSAALQTVTTPEPTTLAMLGAGLLGILVFSRRRFQNS